MHFFFFFGQETKFIYIIFYRHHLSLRKNVRKNLRIQGHTNNQVHNKGSSTRQRDTNIQHGVYKIIIKDLQSKSP